MSRKWLCYALALWCIVGLAMADQFDDADKNSDGSLSRHEFADYVDGLHAKLMPYLAEVNNHSQGHSGHVLGGAWGDGSAEDGATAGNTSDLVASTIASLGIIIVTELGDKTFFIAAILAMRHGRMIVYSGAMLALGLMHILSCFMGLALPSILPRKYTHFASAILFLYFGYALLKDAREMGDGPSEELQEAEEELGAKKGDDDAAAATNDEENGGAAGSSAGSKGNTGSGVTALQTFMQTGELHQLMKNETFKVFWQAFSVTFLAEWGDRSQIATIGLAASKNVWGIIIGGLVGHALCTGLAVVGGKLLSTRMSPKTIALAGGALFLAFGVHALFFQE